MAGFRDFQTGEVLTAANVNDFLAKQSVMKFADATARDTALGTAVGGSNALREGMVAYLDDTDAVQFYDGTAWGDVGSDPNAGIGSNVVQAVKTDTFTSTSSSYTSLTGLSVSITPSSNTSKILVVAAVNGATSQGTTDSLGGYRLVRDSTPIAIATSVGSRTATTGSLATRLIGTTAVQLNSVGFFLDSPATGSSVTYSVEVSVSAGTIFINRSEVNPDDPIFRPSISTLTAIEVAA